MCVHMYIHVYDVPVYLLNLNPHISSHNPIPCQPKQVVATVDDQPLVTRVRLARALGECVVTQEDFLALLDKFVEGTAVKAEVPELLRRVRCLSFCFGGKGVE